MNGGASGHHHCLDTVPRTWQKTAAALALAVSHWAWGSSLSRALLFRCWQRDLELFDSVDSVTVRTPEAHESKLEVRRPPQASCRAALPTAYWRPSAGRQGRLNSSIKLRSMQQSKRSWQAAAQLQKKQAAFLLTEFIVNNLNRMQYCASIETIAQHLQCAQ